ncbi:MAG: hypothetical protein ACT4QA_15750 [Panacagrimonas sp.]
MRTLFLFVSVLAMPTAAWAYIDPNTGGMILQMLAPIIAAIAGAWLMAKDYIKRIFFRLIGREPKAEREDHAASTNDHK